MNMIIVFRMINFYLFSNIDFRKIWMRYKFFLWFESMFSKGKKCLGYIKSNWQEILLFKISKFPIRLREKNHQGKKFYYLKLFSYAVPTFNSEINRIFV